MCIVVFVLDSKKNHLQSQNGMSVRKINMIVNRFDFVTFHFINYIVDKGKNLALSWKRFDKKSPQTFFFLKWFEYRGCQILATTVSLSLSLSLFLISHSLITPLPLSYLSLSLPTRYLSLLLSISLIVCLAVLSVRMLSRPRS